MSKIIYTQENGVVAVVHPSDQSLKEMTIEEIAQRVVPVGITTYSIVADSVIPTDRSFRNSWVGVGIGSTSETTITEDIEKAKEWHKTKIREANVHFSYLPLLWFQTTNITYVSLFCTSNIAKVMSYLKHYLSLQGFTHLYS